MDSYTQEVVACLEDLGSGIPTSIVLEEGICLNLEARGLPHGAVSRYSSSWESYSGDRGFPIPCPEGDRKGKTWWGRWAKFWHDRDVDTPWEVYARTRNMWAGEQGELRRSLCLHVAKKLRDASSQ